jgi:hypothetical protein
MRLFTIVIVMISLAGAAKGQTKTGNFKCVFADTLTMADTVLAGLIQNFGSNAALSSDLPDSLLGKLDSAFRKQMSFRRPTQLQTRYVMVAGDTTIVELADDVVHIGFQAPVGVKKMVMVKGRDIIAVYDRDGETLVLPVEDRQFKRTGEQRSIVGYLCEEYKSDDNTVSVWITTELPSTINPGVKNVNIEGAILSFAINREGSCLISTIKTLEFLK